MVGGAYSIYIYVVATIQINESYNQLKMTKTMKLQSI